MITGSREIVADGDKCKFSEHKILTFNQYGVPDCRMDIYEGRTEKADQKAFQIIFYQATFNERLHLEEEQVQALHEVLNKIFKQKT